MKRIERRLFKISDEIAALQQAEQLAAEELNYHRHLNDDTQRDAAVSSSPFDRADARGTASDVARFERHIDDLKAKRARLEARRSRLLTRLRD